MDFLLPAIFILMLAGAPAAVEEEPSAQTYWRSVLPRTPIPYSIQEILRKEKEISSFELGRTPTVFLSYKCAASEKQLHDPNAPLFFLKNNLKPGTKMTLDLTKSLSTPPFLSIEMAKSTPFSSARLSEILSFFSVKDGSAEASAMRRTLAECEESPLEGERKSCVRSLEAMAEFVKAVFGGSDVRLAETAATKDMDRMAARQEYVVGPMGGRRVEADALVSCHPEPYPNAVYYCHTTRKIEAYKVKLLRADGAVIDAVATCHVDTSAWDPNYIGFKLLNVKPGTESICHFLPPGHLIFFGFSKEDTSVL